MAGFNQVTLVGNLTRDPEMRTTGSGKSVCNFSLAVNERAGQSAQFFDVTAWDKQAELVTEYLSKGSPVLVAGRLHTDSWDDQEGNKRSKIVIVANGVTFLGKKEDGKSSKEEQYDSQGSAFKEEAEIPF